MTEEQWVPNTQATEVERARLEDAAFAVDLAKARARGAGETYDPERHGPFERPEILRPYKPPVLKVSKLGPTTAEIEAMMARFKAYGGPRLVKDWKEAAAGDK
jgi:hypothetical protein